MSALVQIQRSTLASPCAYPETTTKFPSRPWLRTARWSTASILRNWTSVPLATAAAMPWRCWETASGEPQTYVKVQPVNLFPPPLLLSYYAANSLSPPLGWCYEIVHRAAEQRDILYKGWGEMVGLSEWRWRQWPCYCNREIIPIVLITVRHNQGIMQAVSSN